MFFNDNVMLLGPGRIQELQKESDEKAKKLKEKYGVMAAGLGVSAIQQAVLQEFHWSKQYNAGTGKIFFLNTYM